MKEKKKSLRSPHDPTFQPFFTRSLSWTTARRCPALWCSPPVTALPGNHAGEAACSGPLGWQWQGRGGLQNPVPPLHPHGPHTTPLCRYPGSGKNCGGRVEPVTPPAWVRGSQGSSLCGLTTASGSFQGIQSPCGDTGTPSLLPFHGCSGRQAASLRSPRPLVSRSEQWESGQP